MGRTRRTLCRHFGTFWATEKASARIIPQNPGCLSGEMMTQNKEQEDARRRLRGMCGFQKELRVCWMEMEVE